MLELQFILTYDNTDYVVDEPDGFKNFNSVLERDFDTHGVFFQFTDSDLKLKFPGSGRDVLKAASDGFGVDAIVDLTVKRRFKSTESFSTIYTGTAIIENLELDEDYASCDFEEINDMIKIKDRLDVVVSTDATEDLDGGAMSAATSITLEQVSKGISVTSSGNVTDSQNPTVTTSSIIFKNVPASTNLFVDDFDVGDYNLIEVKNEIQYFDEKKGFTPGISSIQSGSNPTYIELGGQLNAGPLYVDSTITIALEGEVRFINDVLNVGRGIVSFKIVELTLQSDETYSQTSVTTIDTYDLSAVPAKLETMPTISGSNTYDVKTGEIKQFKLRVEISYGGATTDDQEMFMNVTPGLNNIDFSITYTEKYPESNIDTYFIHESLRHNVQAITGRDMFYSPYFGRTTDGYTENGCVWNYTEANGYRVRNFGSRPNQISLKDRLDSLKSIFAVGYGIERDAPEYDTYRFRLDTYDYWYNDELLYQFDDVVDYKEEYFNWFSFNEVEIGYKKYANDEDHPGTLDDWNTKAGYLMPVNRLRGKKTWLSDYIASDYLIEYTRRKQFTREPTRSWKYDDDLFIMDVQDDGGTWIPGSVNNDLHSLLISGFENPIVFNKIINPRFNIHNQYAVLNSLCYKKTILDQYKNTYFRNNGSSLLGYAGDASQTVNCLGDLIKYNVSNVPSLKSNITLSEMRDANRLFDPIKVSFKQALSTTQLDNIIEAHRNGAASGNNGYFRVTSPDNETVEGWLLKLSFNYADQIGNFEMIKKAEAYSI